MFYSYFIDLIRVSNLQLRKEGRGMKRIKIIFLVTLIFLITIICIGKLPSNHSIIINSRAQSLELINDTPSIIPTKNNVTVQRIAPKRNTEDNIDNEILRPLDDSDFIVSDGANDIVLDSIFSKFNPEKPEKQIENNYVGEEYVGDYAYKIFTHEYPDYDLYVSNLEYNIKNRNFDEYYITQITLTNSNYKTARGTAIGSRLTDIYKVYGYHEICTKEEAQDYITYQLNQKEITFFLSKDKKVIRIILCVNKDNQK
jgi:hypothetical protein